MADVPTKTGHPGGQGIFSQAHAASLDSADPLAHFRANFYIPTLADLRRPTIAPVPDEGVSEQCTYLCGNSLGLQPRRTADYVHTYLTQWRTKAVTGHFVDHEDSVLRPFLDIDDQAAKLVAPVVGASQEEVAVMGTLTANLHLLMASFYRPSKKGEGRWKILLEGKAFPSDHYAVESQIVHHGLDPAEAMILLEPKDPRNPILPTEQILKTIDEHASELALILLPGIQFYSGQYFDIPKITAHAHSHGIVIGWDCAHAVGNIDLKLHDWDVDFAAWCSYKYLNSGPGGMAGIFVNAKYGQVDKTDSKPRFWPRLSGWWGDDKTSRFQMTNNFIPRPGAAGYQLSNPSAIDLAAVIASLRVFNETSMSALREKSLKLTNYLEQLLDELDARVPGKFTIITPRTSKDRGAQLSVRLAPGLLDGVLEHLEAKGVILDERKPDVIRVAPAPLYNTFEDVWRFCTIFEEALSDRKHSSDA